MKPAVARPDPLSFLALLVLPALGALAGHATTGVARGLELGQAAPLCGISADSGCASALTGEWSRLLGVRLSILATALFAFLLVQGLVRWPLLRDREGALAAYRRSLAIEPFQPPVGRAVAWIEGREEDFAAGWEGDVQATIESLPTTEDLRKQYPKAVAVTVLDHSVVRVNPDGTSQTFVHMVYKLLDEKGVEKYGDLPNAGELRVVRAILPDGTVAMPTGLPYVPTPASAWIPTTRLVLPFRTWATVDPETLGVGCARIQISTAPTFPLETWRPTNTMGWSWPGSPALGFQVMDATGTAAEPRLIMATSQLLPAGRVNAIEPLLLVPKVANVPPVRVTGGSARTGAGAIAPAW